MSKPVRKPLSRKRMDAIRERIGDPVYVDRALEKLAEGISEYFVKEKIDLDAASECWTDDDVCRTQKRGE